MVEIMMHVSLEMKIDTQSSYVPRTELRSHLFSFTNEHRIFVMHLTGLALVKSNLYLIRIIFFNYFLYILST